MEIIDLSNYEEKRYKTAVALGNFDGVHIGHKYLIQSMVKEARERNLKSSVLLFKNHTRDVLKNHKNVKFNIITSNNQKFKILKDLGVEIVYTMDFNENIMRLTGREFVEKIIIQKLNSKLVTVGFDYKFGHKASGDSDYLQELGLEKDFFVNVINPIYIGEDIVSSTAVRQSIKSGHIGRANKLLGYRYIVEGTVIGGKGRGTKLGYPTANIRLNHNYILPKPGVYKTNTFLGDKKYLSITNIGYNPTFEENDLKIETHILNFDNDIYNEFIEVEFIDFIRDVIKFNTVEELINQIKADTEFIK